MSFLEIRDLSVEYAAKTATVHALNGVAFELEEGGSLGLVGESGCGKSTLAMALLGLLPGVARFASGSIRIGGAELVGIDPEAMRRMRWREIAYVPQSAATSLSPVTPLFRQFAEAWNVHHPPDRKRLRERAEALFRAVELSPRWLDAYPHQLSGGMRQRVIIALALLFDPKLLVADEPTTGLDVIVQRQVLDVLKRLQAEHGTTLVFVSHDIAVVAELCRELAVMYGGEIVELGTTRQVLKAPCHPYTLALKQSFPDIRQPEQELFSIPGRTPILTAPPRGCVFADRCPFARPRCREEKPAPRPLADGRRVACHFAEEAEEMRAVFARGEAWSRLEAVV